MVLTINEYTLQQHAARYPCASGPPPDPHHQFTIGSMVCVDVQKGDPLYGVVKWIGTVPDFPGTIAGLEMVSHDVTYVLVTVIYH